MPHGQEPETGFAQVLAEALNGTETQAVKEQQAQQQGEAREAALDEGPPELKAGLVGRRESRRSMVYGPWAFALAYLLGSTSPEQFSTGEIQPEVEPLSRSLGSDPGMLLTGPIQDLAAAAEGTVEVPTAVDAGSLSTEARGDLSRADGTEPDLPQPNLSAVLAPDLLAAESSPLENGPAVWALNSGKDAGHTAPQVRLPEELPVGDRPREAKAPAEQRVPPQGPQPEASSAEQPPLELPRSQGDRNQPVATPKLDTLEVEARQAAGKMDAEYTGVQAAPDHPNNPTAGASYAEAGEVLSLEVEPQEGELDAREAAEAAEGQDGPSEPVPAKTLQKGAAKVGAAVERRQGLATQTGEPLAVPPEPLRNGAPELESVEQPVPLRPVFDLRQPEALRSNLVRTMESMITEERTEVRIELKPEHLGEMRIKLSMERGIMVAEFLVQDRRVQELLSAQLPQLQLALQEQGTVLGEVSINVGLGQEGELSQQDQPQQRPQGRSAQGGTSRPAAAGAPRYAGSSWYRVDVRV